MPSTGRLQVRAYSGNAQLPLQNVSIAVTAQDGTSLAMALTDRSGKIEPITLPVPDLAESQTPDAGATPFTTVNLHARLRGYEQIYAQDIQIFADTLTVQNLLLIPLSELPGEYDRTEDFVTPPQNL